MGVGVGGGSGKNAGYVRGAQRRGDKKNVLIMLSASGVLIYITNNCHLYMYKTKTKSFGI